MLYCMVQVSLTKKIEKLFSVLYQTAPTTLGWRFRLEKRKKRNNEKKVSKQKLLKGCRQEQNITVLVMFLFHSRQSRIQKFSTIIGRQYFLVLHGFSTLKSNFWTLSTLALHRKLIILRCVLGGFLSFVVLLIMA